MSEFDFTVMRDENGGWCVFLPHQCDKWDIAGEVDGSHADGVGHAEAVAALEKFIAEAQEALASLKSEQEMGGEELWAAPSPDARAVTCSCTTTSLSTTGTVRTCAALRDAIRRCAPDVRPRSILQTICWSIPM
jgi:hypothetical protein